MAERVINVTVSNVNTKNVTVSSKQVANEISATADSSIYYSQLAKNWAIGEGLIQNEDYSSKTYAGVAQEAAESAQGSANTAQALVNDFSGVVDNAITEIDGVKTEALTAVTSSKDLALSDISATQSSALTEIGDLKNSSLTEISASLENATGNITDAQSNAVETVSTLGDNYISNINTTGDKYIADIGNAGENYIDNINSTGKGFDNLTQRQITNCLLEVPQRIKYDLVDGTLTIKAGSVVIVPYGVEDLTAQYPVGSTFLNDNFKVADTQYEDGKFFVWAELVGDISRGYTVEDTLQRVIIIDTTNSGISNFIAERQLSGSSPTATQNYSGVYDTTANLVGICHGNTTLNYDNGFSLPLLITNVVDTQVFGSVSQVFNGMGYIGSTIWCDKGVKGLIPNGRNEDGSLKNLEWVNDSFHTYTHTQTSTAIQVYYADANGGGWFRYPYVYFQEEEPIATSGMQRWYKPSDNLWYERTSSEPWKVRYPVLLANFDITTGVISNFNPKQAISVPDIQDVVRKTGDTMTGYLNINSNTYVGVRVYNTIADATQSTLSVQENYMYFGCYDKNNNNTGEILTKHMTNGSVGTCVRARNYSTGSSVTSEIQVGVDANGNAYAKAPNCNITGGIVTQAALSKATNGYMKLGNGMILQWGVHSSDSGGGEYTITLPTAFSNTNYSVVGVSRGDKVSNSDYQVHFKITSKTQFKKTGQVATGLYWFAIGY